ncbi:MAG TPA: glycosyltransferase family 4 protein [Chromatiaceae bacterium]|nr:glycosyltransferase family 4 protein [Chromatiaceae bacterium]
MTAQTPCTGTPSKQLPNAVLEAMACALPCCVARVSGSHELIQDGRTGATFPTDDADGLGQAIAAVTGARGEALGQAARALVAERFDIERVADQYEALYARILRAP